MTHQIDTQVWLTHFVRRCVNDVSSARQTRIASANGLVVKSDARNSVEQRSSLMCASARGHTNSAVFAPKVSNNRKQQAKKPAYLQGTHSSKEYRENSASEAREIIYTQRTACIVMCVVCLGNRNVTAKKKNTDVLDYSCRASLATTLSLLCCLYLYSKML